MGATYIISAWILLGRHLAAKETRKCSLSMYPASKVISEERDWF